MIAQKYDLSSVLTNFKLGVSQALKATGQCKGGLHWPVKNVNEMLSNRLFRFRVKYMEFAHIKDNLGLVADPQV